MGVAKNIALLVFPGDNSVPVMGGAAGEGWGDISHLLVAMTMVMCCVL